MPTPLTERITEELHKTDFNYTLVADRTGASLTYVKRVADSISPVSIVAVRDAARPDGASLTPAPLTAPLVGQVEDHFLSAVIPQNQEAFIELRDLTYEQLIQRVGEEDSLTPSLLIRLLRLLLEHEAQIRAIARPLATLNVDQRRVSYNVQALIGKMEELPLDELRGLINAPRALPPVIIDG